MVKSAPVVRNEGKGTFAKRVLFVALLLCSVCMPLTALADETKDKPIRISDVVELHRTLLSGLSTITLEGAGNLGDGYSLATEEGFKFRPDNSSDDIRATTPWLKTSSNIDFSGVTSFQNANYGQPDIAETFQTDFKGGAIHNEARMQFKGRTANFLDNVIDTGFVQEEKEYGTISAKGAGVYNLKDFITADTVLTTFKGNKIQVGGKDKNGVIAANALGGAFYNEGTATFKGKTQFIENEVDQIHQFSQLKSYGGAVYNTSSLVFDNETVFQSNKALSGTKSMGGGLFNSGVDNVNNEGEEERTPDVVFKGKTTFSDNVAQTALLSSYGGGLANEKGKVHFEKGSEAYFIGNKVILTSSAGETAAGGGLYNLGKNAKTIFDGKSSFQGNKVEIKGTEGTASGSGLYSFDGEVIFNGVTSFKNNTISAKYGRSYGIGGAVHTSGMDEDNSQQGRVVFNNSAEFIGNSIEAATLSVGGAIANYSTVEFNAPNGQSNILFQGNSVYNTMSETEYEAIYPNPINVEFIQARGGAFYNSEGNAVFGKGTDVVFKQNTATSLKEEGLGGAIYNDFYSQTLNAGTIEFLGSVSFEENSANTAGGAIYNKGNMILSGVARLTGNKAPKGGAVYNDAGATFTLSGSDVSFKNNEADLGANIYNLGTVKIESVKDTMDIDYAPYTTAAYPESSHTLFDKTGDIYNKGAIEIDHSDLQLFGGINTKQKNKDGSVSIEDSRVDLGQNTIYADTVDIKKNSKVITHIESGSNGKIEANTVSISNDNTSLGVVVGVGEIKKGETKEYQIIKASKSTGDFQNLSENMLYEVKEKEGADGVYQIRKLTDGEAQLKAEETAKNPYCKDGKCDEYSKEASNAWIDNEKIEGNEQASLMQEKLNELAQMHGTNTDDYQEAINSLTPDSSALIASHASEVTRQISNALSKRFYDQLERTHFVYNGKVHYKAPKETSRVWMHSLYSTGENTGKKEFEMDTMGVIIGAETPIDKNLKVGAAYTYSFADGKGMNRDTEIQTHAGIVYAQYQPSRLYVNGFAMYGQSTVTEERKVLSQKVESEYDVNIAAAEVIAGYKLGPVVVGNWVSGVLAPEAGLRYVYTKQKEYTDTLGQTVEAADAHALTGILGARYTVGYSLSPSIQWYPELRAAVTYDFISPTLDNQVVLLNGAGYSIESEEMDKFGIEIGLKMGFEIDNRTEIGIEYEGLFKGDYTNHTGTANVKYNF